MLGLDNPIHLLFLLVLLLLVFGAKRLPEMGRSLGTGLKGFKDSISGDDGPAEVEHAPQRVEDAPAAAPVPVRPVADAPPVRPVDTAPAADRAPVQPAA